MKLLLDENVPRQLTNLFDQHEARRVRYQGWLELENGELLEAMREAGFEVLVTTDVSIYNQQKAHLHGVAILILRVFNNKIESLEPLIAEAQLTAHQLSPGEVQYIYASPRLRASDQRRGRGEFAR
jgi:predicted nuclease of predicted toxin-antitoxin system